MSLRKNQKIKHSYEKNISILPIVNPTKAGWLSSSNKKLKKDIKNHYSIVQDDICAYCRLPVRYDGYGEPIEHIVPKSIMVKWMFHPKNLCLSCYGCNTKKSDKDTLVSRLLHIDNFNNYPKVSTDFNIVHPHIDIFSNHIYEENLIYKPKAGSQKGRNTIDFCQLNRFDVLYSKARLKRNSNKQLINKLTSITLDTTNSPNEIASAIEMINKIIERYDYLVNLNP
jgi:uncharacterized protein (TIGR02646 family)